MLRKELVIGFVVAGLADAAVPVSFWRSLFLTGHGFWSVLENVILGPFLAIISFVCSIGNVPLAAALWSGGIAFGGTVARPGVLFVQPRMPRPLHRRPGQLRCGTRSPLNAVARYRLPACVGGGSADSVHRHGTQRAAPGQREPVLTADTGDRGNRPHGTGTSVTSAHGLMDLPPTGTSREAAEEEEEARDGSVVRSWS